MEHEFDILLPNIMAEDQPSQPAEKTKQQLIRNPYIPTDRTINELHERSHEKMQRLFPDCPPYELVRRINKEVEALWYSPSTYSLLIAADTIRILRHFGTGAFLKGAWECSYYAYLMDLIEENPTEMGRSFDELLHQNEICEPVQITIEPGYRKTCIRILHQCARSWGFWLHPQGRGQWKLISFDNTPKDVFSLCAPQLILKIRKDDNHGKSQT